MDVTTLMRRSARIYRERECVVAGATRLTFAQAWDRAVRLANGLIAMGLKPGDRVGVLEDNTLEAADFFIGAAIANLVRVPLYPRNGRAAHAHMLGHTGCRVALVAENHAHELEGIADELENLERVFVRDAGYEDWLIAQSDVDPMIPAAPDDYYIIRHTGGTTGLGKGVAYTHKSWLAAGRDWFYLFPPVEPGDKCLHLGPISHGSGYQFLPIMLGGGCNVMVEHFDASETVALLEKEGIGFLFMAPTMVNMVNQEPTVRQRDYSKLKCILIAAAPIADDTALTAREIFGNKLWQGYGQTEVLPVAFMTPNQWFAEVEGSTPLRACGLPLPFAELEIWDENNRPVGIGEEGQIVAKTDGQMTGFWNDPVATEERIVDGWVLTGDIGRLDENGYLYMLDRSDDMIISGGFNIWPAELENVVTGHPDVIEAACFGIPHDKWGETPALVCQVAAGVEIDPQVLVDMCADELGSYKKPGEISFTTEPLPKSPVGKIMRKTLREPYWAGRDRRVGGN